MSLSCTFIFSLSADLRLISLSILDLDLTLEVAYMLDRRVPGIAFNILWRRLTCETMLILQILRKIFEQGQKFFLVTKW